MLRPTPTGASGQLAWNHEHPIGVEYLHDYVRVIYEAARAAQLDALVMTQCAHPYFAHVTDALGLNDWSVKSANIIEQTSTVNELP